MIFAIAFIDYDGDNELVMEQVEALSECEAMAEFLEAQYYDTTHLEVAVTDNDTTLFQDTIDELGYNIEIQALPIEY